MGFNDIEKKKIENTLKAFLDRRRPPVEIRNKVDINYRIEKQSILIFEIRPVWNNPAEYRETPVAKATFTRSGGFWKIYWRRSDLKWHAYEPAREVNTVDEFIAIVDRDEYGCFWG